VFDISINKWCPWASRYESCGIMLQIVSPDQQLSTSWKNKEAILSNSLTASNNKKNGNVTWAMMFENCWTGHRCTGMLVFPSTTLNRQKTFKKQLGQQKRTNKDGRLHRFTNRRNTVRGNVEIQRRNVLTERTKYPLTAPTCVNLTGTDPENGCVIENRKNHLASKTYRGCPLNIRLKTMHYQQYWSVRSN
jgi:hypothetical protein